MDNLGSHDPYSDAILYHVEIKNRVTGHSFRKVGVTKQARTKKRFGSGTFSKTYDVVVLSETKLSLITALEHEEQILESLDDNGSRFLEHELKGHYIGGWTECYRINDAEAIDIVEEQIKEIQCRNTM